MADDYQIFRITIEAPHVKWKPRPDPLPALHLGRPGRPIAYSKINPRKSAISNFSRDPAIKEKFAKFINI
jgi:hypothetical protein